MKHRIMAFFQKVLGLETYYFIFSCIKIYTLNFDSRKRVYNYFVKLLEPHYNVMVAGGFIGITTAPIAKQCKNGSIFVFEPVKLNVSVLKRIQRFFKLSKLTITHAALGNEEKTLKIKTPILNGAVYNGMSHLEHLDYLDTNHYIEDTIEIINGDRFFAEKKIQLHAIKLVAENYEWEIYNGLYQTIVKDRPIVYTELWDALNRSKIVDFFAQLNYNIYILDQKMTLQSYDGAKHDTKFFILKPQ